MASVRLFVVCLVVSLLASLFTSYAISAQTTPTTKSCTTSRSEKFRLAYIAATGPVAGYRIFLEATRGDGTKLISTVNVPNQTLVAIKTPAAMVGLLTTYRVAAIDATNAVGPQSSASLPNYPFGDAGDFDSNGNINSADHVFWVPAYKLSCEPRPTLN